MKRLALLLFAPMVAYAQTCNYPPCYYNHTTINPLPPYYLGTTGLIPVVLNSYTITGTVTANSTTFVCATNCTKLLVGQGITGSDGVNQLYPSISGQLGTLITNVGTGINGATITTNYPSNAALTPGSYTITVGKDRWDLNSTAVVNSIGTNHIWGGLAANGNSTWAQQWLSGDCDTGTKVTNCFLAIPGTSIGNFFGGRTSDGMSESNTFLAVNDNTSVQHSLWNQYWETILLPGAGTGKETHAIESTVFNFNSAAQFVDPYHANVGTTIENIRLTSGQPTMSVIGTMYNASDAISVLPIDGIGYEVGFLFASGSLDEVTTSHPPALSLPANAKGYGIAWYEAAGYTTPAWNLYATNTTANTNTFALNDSNATLAIDNPSGTGQVLLESGAIATTGTHEAVFSGTGNNAGLDIGSATINDPTSSGTLTYGAISHFGIPTLTSTNAVTLSDAVTLSIEGCPAASTGVTITVCHAMRVLAGTSRFDGRLDTFAGINVDGAMYVSSTAPTIFSGFNTSGGTITGAATAAFSVTVGTSTGTTTGVLSMPTAVHGWACSAADVTTPATHMIQQTASSTTAVTVTDYARTTGVAQNMANSDVIVMHCGAF